MRTPLQRLLRGQVAPRLLTALGLRRRESAAETDAADASRKPALAVNPSAASSAIAARTVAPIEVLLQRLEWTVIRRLDGLLQGPCRTRLRGAGLDLADLREYQPHDDVRHIDWNVTARTDTPHVRQFQEDRDMTVTFVLDLSASVNWGSVLADTAQAADASPLRTKHQVAVELVGVLARLFVRDGHRIGAILYRGAGRPTEELPARTGRGQVLNLLARITSPPSPASPLPMPPAEPIRSRANWFAWRASVAPTADTAEATQLADLLRAAEHRLKRRGTLLLVSDFISQPGWAAPLGRLALRHDVVAVRLSDPSEQELPAMGLVRLRDAESGADLLVDTDDPALRARHAELAQAQDEAVRRALIQAGVDTLELGTAEPLIDTLRRFLMLRGLRPATPMFRTTAAEATR